MSDAPRRIQLSRKKGWKMPENTVKVDRSTKWGNPWPIGEVGPLLRTAPDAVGAVGLFRMMMDDDEMRSSAGYPSDISALRGKNLACWCQLVDQHGNHVPCHADVLLALANAEEHDNG